MSRGKYAKIVDKLPKLNNVEPERRERIEERKRQIIEEHRTLHSIPPTAAFLSAMYKELREQKEEIQEELSEINLDIEAHSQLIAEQFEAEGIASLRLSEGGSVRVQYEPYAQVYDHDKFRLWCLANGYERSMSLPWQTTNAVTKEMLLRGDPEPDGVQAFVATKLVLTKGD